MTDHEHDGDSPADGLPVAPCGTQFAAGDHPPHDWEGLNRSQRYRCPGEAPSDTPSEAL